MKPSRPILACLLLALAVSPGLAREEWYDHYEDALQALDRGSYGQAIESLEAALERKPRSGYLRTYGNNYLRYLPHFYLGVAYHGAGDCRRALESFERSQEAGETEAESVLAARLGVLKADCEAALAPPSSPSPEPAPVAVVEPAASEKPPAPRVAVDAERLERGLRSYLDGDLEAAERVFDELVRSAPESPDLRLLHGMALHGRWAAGGEQDALLLERARRELAEAARLEPGLVPDPALCPPRVLALYRSLRPIAGS